MQDKAEDQAKLWCESLDEAGQQRAFLQLRRCDNIELSMKKLQILYCDAV